MTHDENWDFLRAICIANNENWPFDKIRDMVEPKLAEMTEQHYEAFSMCIPLDNLDNDKEFLNKYKDFLINVANGAKRKEANLPTAFRYSLMEVIIEDSVKNI